MSSIVSLDDDKLFCDSVEQQKPVVHKRKVIMIEDLGPAELYQLTLKRNKEVRYDWRKSVVGLRCHKAPRLHV
jgi:hypothetical protein